MSRLKQLVLVTCLCVGQQVYANNMQVIGWVEPVQLDFGGIQLAAKIDTGADHSSLSATKLRRFSKSNKDWVEFELLDTKGIRHKLKAPVERYTRVKRKGAESQHRPVIQLGICLDGNYKKTNVSLTDRDGFKYKALIGRSYLKGLFLVDSGVKNTTTPSCTNEKEASE